jgi:hypothetical protein
VHAREDYINQDQGQLSRKGEVSRRQYDAHLPLKKHQEAIEDPIREVGLHK